MCEGKKPKTESTRCLQAFLERKREVIFSGNKKRILVLDDPSEQPPLNKKAGPEWEIFSGNQVNKQLSSQEGEAQTETQSEESSALGNGNYGNHCVQTAVNDASEDADKLKLLIIKQAECVDVCLGCDEGPRL